MLPCLAFDGEGEKQNERIRVLPAGSNELKWTVLSSPTASSSARDKQYNCTGRTSCGVQSSIIRSVWHFLLTCFVLVFLYWEAHGQNSERCRGKHHRWHIMIDVSILLMLSYQFLNERRKWPITQCIHRSIDHSWCLLRRDANWSGSPKRSGYERLKINVELNFKGCLNRRSSSWRNCISFFCTSRLLADFAVSTSLETQGNSFVEREKVFVRYQILSSSSMSNSFAALWYQLVSFATFATWWCILDISAARRTRRFKLDRYVESTGNIWRSSSTKRKEKDGWRWKMFFEEDTPRLSDLMIFR